MEVINVNAVVEQYGGFDGAIVLGMGFDIGTSNLDRCVWVMLRAYCESTDEGLSGWYNLRLEARSNLVFAWEEVPWNTNLIINYPVSVYSLDARTVIDFDPLHSVNVIEGVALSRFYLGGESINIQIIAAPPTCP